MPILFINFYPHLIYPVLNGEKKLTNLKKTNFHPTFVKNVASNGKNLMRVSVKLQIRHTSKILCAEEKDTSKYFLFDRGTHHCENWIFCYTNIWKYFQIQNQLNPVFRTSHSTRPQKFHILHATLNHLNCNRFCCKSSICN